MGKVVFFGTSQFAVSMLKRFTQSGNSVVSVVTQPDKKSGRRLKVIASPVKEEAQRLGLSVYQPEDLNDAAFLNKLKSFEADFFVVVAFGSILSKDVLGIPKFCSLNVHPSLLPKYRGAAPINWAVINGEKKTGVTVIKMNEKMDAGDIVTQKEINIGPLDTNETLNSKLEDVGGELLVETIKLIAKGKAHFVKQNEKDVSFAPKLTKEDGRIDWSLDTEAIINRIRGLKSWPGTYTIHRKHTLKIVSAEPKADVGFAKFSPGEVIKASEREGLIIRTGNGAISITGLQLEGKKAMPYDAFLRGYKLDVSVRLG